MNMLRKAKLFRLIARRKIGRLKIRHRLYWLALAVISIPLLTLYGGPMAQADNKQPTPTTPVSVAVVVTKDIPLYISALGSVTPINNVTVKTQVNGQLMSVFFQEGQLVQAGSKLAQVDPRPYEAQVLQSQGQLERDQSLLLNAQRDLDRYTTLFRQDSVSQQILDTQAALVKQYEGIVSTDQGQVEVANLNLNYCNITSPIDGLAGFLQVDPGNNIMVTDPNGIVIINSINPIYAVFSITEADLPRVMKKFASGVPLPVDAQDRSQTKILASGNLSMIDNQIDPTTGTIKLKATFDNQDKELFPNQFVNIRLLINTIKDATVIPTAAVQYGVQGTFAYVVNEDQTVSIKNISVLGSTENDSAIVGEIKPGDSVVLEGADKIKEGTKISILQDQVQTEPTKTKKAAERAGFSK